MPIHCGYRAELEARFSFRQALAVSAAADLMAQGQDQLAAKVLAANGAEVAWEHHQAQVLLEGYLAALQGDDGPEPYTPPMEYGKLSEIWSDL